MGRGPDPSAGTASSVPTGPLAMPIGPGPTCGEGRLSGASCSAPISAGGPPGMAPGSAVLDLSFTSLRGGFPAVGARFLRGARLAWQRTARRRLSVPCSDPEALSSSHWQGARASFPPSKRLTPIGTTLGGRRPAGPGFPQAEQLFSAAIGPPTESGDQLGGLGASSSQ